MSILSMIHFSDETSEHYYMKKNKLNQPVFKINQSGKGIDIFKIKIQLLNYAHITTRIHTQENNLQENKNTNTLKHKQEYTITRTNNDTHTRAQKYKI